MTYFYEEGGNWHPLPQWGKFFISLGNYVAEFGGDQQRLVIAVAVPSRLYAASLTAFGVVVRKATVPSLTPQTYFRQLCALHIGTPVTYINGERRLKGIFEGIEDLAGDTRTEKRLKVRVENKRTGGLTHLVPIEKAYNIRLGATPTINLPNRQAGYRVRTSSKFLEDCLGRDHVSTYLAVSQLDCLIIGKTSLFETEIKQTQFAYARSLGSCRNSGPLQDVLRSQRFLSTSDQTFHSEVIASTTQTNNSLQKKMRPFVTVFDGGLSFTRKHADYADSHWVVILDRTEPSFRDGVELINQEFLNRLEDGAPCSPPSSPVGIELLAYRQEFK